MAKHIVHRYKTEANETFTNEELLLGEIGINVGKGTLTISKKDGDSVENVDFINKNTIEGQLNDLTTSLNNEIDTFRTDVSSTFNDVNTRITSLETEVETNINNNIETIRGEFNTASSEFQNQLSGIDSRVTEISDELNTEGFTKIIASPTEPSQDCIWLDEHDVEVNAGDYQYDIHSMFLAIQELQKTVKRYEELFQTINCGTVTDNSSRQEIMDEATPEAPEGYFDNVDPEMILTLTADMQNIQIVNHYLAAEASYGISIDSGEWSETIPSDFDNDKPYLWRYFTTTYDGGEEIKTEPIAFLMYNMLHTLDAAENQYALGESSEEFPENEEGVYTNVIPDFNEEKPYLWCYTKPIYLEESNKPSYSDFSTGNVKHLVIKSAKSQEEIRSNLKELLNYEMVWCEGDNGLYIKSNNNLVKINGGNSFAPDNDNNTENEDIMNGIISSGDSIGSITFISSNDKKYTMKVDNDGNLQVYNSNLDNLHKAPDSGKPGEWVNDIFIEKFYINSLYCGGIYDAEGTEINEHSLNPCSHNFVELSNMTNEDINLNGLSLQYADQEYNWSVLPLWGVIKKGSTFLIRGAQCSIMNHNTTVIKVADYDMEWRDKNGELIKFDNKSAKFYLTYGTEKCTEINPYKPASGSDKVKLKYGYIDLVGLMQKNGDTSPGGFEKNVYSELSSSYLFKKYYAMDNVSQANKAKDARDNSKDWYYVDLRRDDILPDVTSYTPKASYQNKNLFYDKTSLKDGKPTVATITFGIQATDGGANKRATRCFNWVSKGYYDEYLWYRNTGSTTWICCESISGKTGYEKYYNRIQQEATNGEVFTAHKYILKGLEKGTYEYTCGRAKKGSTDPDMDACIDVRRFTVRSDSEVNNGFSFIQVSDQQGFNWDEYQVWRFAADYIVTNHTDAHFLINTGDMTQNGNRLNEWLDYFGGKTSLNGFEEMTTIGNNDLCPAIVYELGQGAADSDKINFANITFFYTFEMDPNNLPIFEWEDSNIGYIPSVYSFNYGNVHFMCLNSEISENTVKNVIGITDINKVGYVYAAIKQWCENDLRINSGATWKIAYCHEMPFTIITNAMKNSFFKDGVEQNFERNGSRINTTTSTENKYWFSKFCQNNNIRLVMGGHKHTQCITWPLIETEVSMKPRIQVTQNDLAAFDNSTSLREINDANSSLNGQKFPNGWFTGTGNTESDLNSSFVSTRCHFCDFELVTGITAPVYSMSQATGYKHTSNKELPADNTPWCRYYYPCSINASTGADKVNNNQRYPFYSIYTINNNEITINVKRIENVIVNGGFNINTQGEAIKNGQTQISTVNGLFAGATTEKVTIKK